MATVEQRKNRFRLIFYHAGRRYTASLKTTDRREAAAAGCVERCLMHLQQGVLDLPEGADLVAFALSGGRREERPKPPAIRTLAELRDRFLQAIGLGSMEANSLYTVRIHLNHCVKTLGSHFPIQTLELSHLQQHVERRVKEKGPRKRPISSVTIRKEETTLRTCWNWGVESGLLTGQFPSRGLKYPKTSEKPPFQTWHEIERRIARGGLTEAERKELWDGLFLTLPQIEEFLDFVQANARHGFLFPMIVTAAHTGARRSELLRMSTADVDFEGGTVLVREKKRVKGRRSTRRVPLSPILAGVLKEWLAVHPGGSHLFCHTATVNRSKKRSPTTGHKGETTRATSLKDRTADVRSRARPESEPLTENEAHEHFKRTLAGSKWAVVRGWHVLRHSFVSLCASRGIDQRLIDTWVGHTTEEMRRRYRHLHPSMQQQAITSVFGERQ